ncbi:MAG TPA: hypothetical protein P5236_03905, partial [Paludibacteraceae bacterium]|nr:hypothetical protein [Paludibacteraceae bacterium]HRU63536.1 hypothetical protein [Paludibacteraceae bacterium]
ARYVRDVEVAGSSLVTPTLAFFIKNYYFPKNKFIMKKQFFILLGCVAILFTSCLKNEESNYTPTISFLTYPITNHNDSLNIKLIDPSGTYQLDTIEVGDTVTFLLGLNGYTNNLTSFYVQHTDSSATKIDFPPLENLNNIFSEPLSDYESGKFIFAYNYSSIYFSFNYIAKKPSNNAAIIFTLSSDAQFSEGSGYNTVSFRLKTPIKQKISIQ